MSCKPLQEMIRKAENSGIGTVELKEKPKRFDADRPHRYAVARIDRPGRLPEDRMVQTLRMLEYCGFSMMGDPEDIRDMPDRPLYFSTLPIAGAPRASLLFELVPLGFRPAPSCKPWISAAGQRDVQLPRAPLDLSRLNHDAGAGRTGKASNGGSQPEIAEATRHRRAVIAAGAAPLRVLHDGKFWVANAAKDDKARMQILRSAGWLPYSMVSSRQGLPKVREKVGDGAWVTKDPFLASPFRPLMSEAAARAHGAAMREARQRIRMSNAADAPEGVHIPAPEGLSYLPYQKAGIHMSVENPDGAFIADDMGLGKSVQTAGIVNMRLDRLEDPARKLSVLIICQANMKIGWQRELSKWMIRDDHTIGIAEGDDFPETDVVIINYDIADRHADRLRARQWDIVAGDEAQTMGNRDTRRTIAILGDGGREREMIPLAPGGIFIPLSGTPIPSRTIQIYPLLSAMDPERWGRGSLGREIFMERYCAPRIMQLPVRTRGEPARDRQGEGRRVPMRPALKEDGSSRLKELQIRMRASGMVRRMKTDPRIMKSLPPKFRQVVELPIELTRDVREMLKSAEADFMALGQAIADQPVPHDEEAFRIALTEEGYEAFREMARMPTGERIDFQMMSRIRANLALLKAPMVGNYLVDVLEASAGAERPQKIVCFGHHRKAIEAIRDRVEREMPGSVVTFLGGDSKRNRQAAVDRLQEDESVRLFLGSIGAASTGLTLTRADRVIFAELDWVPVQLLQAEDRVWRIGQTEHVLSEFLVVGQSIEVNLARRIVDKLDVIAQAIGGNPRFSRRLEEIYASALASDPADIDRIADDSVTLRGVLAADGHSGEAETFAPQMSLPGL